MFSRRSQRHNRGRVAPRAAVDGAANAPLYTLISSVSVIESWRADASDITIATGVSQWNGKKGVASWTQATGADQPTFTAVDATLNNRGSVSGAGGTVHMNSNLNRPAPGTEPTWILAVFRIDTWVVSSSLFAAGTSFMQVSCITATPQIRMRNGVNGTPVGGATEDSWARGQFFFNSAASSIRSGAVSAGPFDCGNNDPGNMLLFARPGPVDVGIMSVAELIFCSGEPSAAELSAIDAQIATYYGAGVLV